MIDWNFIKKQPLEALTNPQIIKQLCDEFQIKPTRGAGQNFLIDPSILDEILAAAEINKDDCVLEIGPGFGALTIALAQKAKQVVAIEKDPHVAKALRKIVEPCENVKLIQGDILQMTTYGCHPEPANAGEGSHALQHQKPCGFPRFARNDNKESSYKLVANLPYSITSQVLRKFTEETPKPSTIVVMVQKEVAERVCAKPGEMSLLSVAVQFYGQPEIVRIVPRNVFWPEPEVDSAILKISNYELERITNVDEKRFFQIVKIGFSSRRKQLQNNLAAGLHVSNEKAREILEKAGLDPKIRAQELAVEDWLELMKCLQQLSS